MNIEFDRRRFDELVTAAALAQQAHEDAMAPHAQTGEALNDAYDRVGKARALLSKEVADMVTRAVSMAASRESV